MGVVFFVMVYLELKSFVLQVDLVVVVLEKIQFNFLENLIVKFLGVKLMMMGMKGMLLYFLMLVVVKVVSGVDFKLMVIIL